MNEKPISTPETEKAFKKYASAAEIKQMAQKVLREIEEAKRFSRGDLCEELEREVEDLRIKVLKLMAFCDQECNRLKPKETIEQRGYNPVDRGMLDLFPTIKKCGGGCGGCSGSC